MNSQVRPDRRQVFIVFHEFSGNIPIKEFPVCVSVLFFSFFIYLLFENVFWINYRRKEKYTGKKKKKKKLVSATEKLFKYPPFFLISHGYAAMESEELILRILPRELNFVISRVVIRYEFRERL